MTEVLILEEVNEDSFVGEEEHLASDKMEDNTYKEHLKKLKSEHGKVRRKINAYTANDVTVTALSTRKKWEGLHLILSTFRKFVLWYEIVES